MRYMGSAPSPSTLHTGLLTGCTILLINDVHLKVNWCCVPPCLAAFRAVTVIHYYTLYIYLLINELLKTQLLTTHTHTVLLNIAQIFVKH